MFRVFFKTKKKNKENAADGLQFVFLDVPDYLLFKKSKDGKIVFFFFFAEASYIWIQIRGGDLLLVDCCIIFICILLLMVVVVVVVWCWFCWASVNLMVLAWRHDDYLDQGHLVAKRKKKQKMKMNSILIFMTASFLF